MKEKDKIFTPKTILAPPKRGAWKVQLPILVLLIIGGVLAYHYNLSAKVTGGVGVLLVFGSGILAWLLGMIALVPFVGPLIVKALTLSLIWLLNAIGYLVSYIAIKRGYSKDVITYRSLTIALLLGIVIGYVIGSIF